MAKITVRIFVCLIVISTGVIAESSTEDHNPPVSEDVREFEELSTSSSSLSSSSSLLSPVSTSPSPSTSSSLLSPSIQRSSSTSERPPDQSLRASSAAFNPSVYLGEIEEMSSQPRISTSIPFNNVQHVRFEGSIGLDGDTGGIYRPHIDHHHYHTDHRQEDYHSPAYAEGYLTVEVPATPVYYSPDEPNHYVNVEVQPHQPVHQHLQAIQPHQHLQTLEPHQQGHQPVHQHLQTLEPHHQGHQPGHQHLQALEPHHHHQPHQPLHQLHQQQTKYEFEPMHYQHLPPAANYYHYSSQLPPVHRPEVTLTKPETLLYLSSHRETQLMKTRKSPYKYYQPNDDTPIHYIEQGHAFPTQHIRVSPWKKLIHLLGTFLPFGLLLAALRPNVKIDNNTTQPSIVLSKWRGIDLPLEHKQDVDDTCEDRSLCEIILSGGDSDAELIPSILWNFAIKSTDEEARRNGLSEIFTSVKKKDCNSISC
ncbi:uncharacterized protein LOC107046805 [Diachasma alloeum]|uniref:uncharacterized protein LOC107046805 n=1 Tax=Diachasma alloeum TaxID=454923 RepID=UPI000738338E|nr:uncharacterized protein LOC107046805 [Diachasma alloeum]